MSAAMNRVDDAHLNILMNPESTTAPDWPIQSPLPRNVLDVRTIKISNISPTVSTKDIREFFSFSGDIQHVDMQGETEGTQIAYVTFENSQGAETARHLTGAVIDGLAVTITPAEDYQLPPEVLAADSGRPAANGSIMKNAEDVMSTMLAKGYALGKDAVEKAKTFDERHHLTSNASATVASIDHKIGLSEKLSIGTSAVNEKLGELDTQFQVLETTKSALAAAEQKAMTAGSAILSNSYVSTGASWFSNAFSVVAKAAEDVATMAKEKAELAEEERKGTPHHNDRTESINSFAETHLDDSFSPREPPVVPVNSIDAKPRNI